VEQVEGIVSIVGPSNPEFLRPNSEGIVEPAYLLAPDLKGATSRSYHDSLGGKPAVGFLMVEAEPEEEAPPLKPERPEPIAEGRPAETPGDIRSARRGRSRLNREPEDIGSSPKKDVLKNRFLKSCMSRSKSSKKGSLKKGSRRNAILAP